MNVRSLILTSVVALFTFRAEAIAPNSIELEYSKIETLPATPGTFIHLQKITIKASCTEMKTVKKLPEWLSQLEDLKELNLGTESEAADRQDCNLVTSLPQDLSRLKSLRKFVIDDALGKTNLTAIANLKMPEGLEIIALNRIDLKEIPEWVFQQKNLKHLALQYGQLRNVPESISNLNQLEKLDLLSNDIQILPKTIVKLNHLKKLVLGNNKMSKKQQSLIKKLIPKVDIIFTNEWDDHRANEE